MQTDWEKAMLVLLEDSKEWAIGIIRKYQDRLLTIQKELGLDVVSVENDIKLQSRILDLWRNAKTFEEYQTLCILYSACSTLRIVSNLDLNRIADSETAVALYLLGCSHGCLEAVDEQQMPSKLYEDHFHSRKSRHFISKRWDKHKDQYKDKLEEIRKIAEERYTNGCKDWHNDLARKIKAKDTRFRDVPIEHIRKVLGDVAIEYGRKRGVRNK